MRTKKDSNQKYDFRFDYLSIAAFTTSLFWIDGAGLNMNVGESHKIVVSSAIISYGMLF